jgi:indolepyruvate ferredoxin oxidoreductase
MGGEGVPWIGQAPFTNERHIFANLGDGTYFHSGYLAIRAAVAAKVPITYKILFNDAVAMTGGQPIDGVLDVPQLTRQVAAEGVNRIVVVTDEPRKYGRRAPFADGVTIRPREQLDQVQRELREYAGVSVLVYDQTCANEKRRRRKRGAYPDPARRVIINELVCEGCGDCSVQSNCLSVEPRETEFGRKRRINQSSCNKDFSCLNGFCPSFVTVEGGSLRKPRAAEATLPDMPEPQLAPLTPGRSYGIVITGVGGTGVVTVGQLIGTAAHLEGRGVSVLDMAGLAQKGGAVYSHVRLAASSEDLFATRIATGEADLLLGCDLIVSASDEALSKIRPGRTRGVVNTAESPTAEFVRDPDWQCGAAELEQRICQAIGAESDCARIDAQALATGLMGDAIYTNPFMLGFAWQRGWLPLRHESLMRAIELNGTAIQANQRAFAWGRAAAQDAAAVRRSAFPAQVIEFKRTSSSLAELVARRVEFLTGYQNAAYARRYSALVDRVRRVESDRLNGSTRLAEAVARYYFKLLAYKDEYEVARLHSDPAFGQSIAAQFEGPYRLNYYLAPPFMARRDPHTGVARKRRFGHWLATVFLVLARLKFLRGTPLDPFGYSAERRTERALIGEYETMIDEVLGRLDARNHALAIELISLPERVRGFGHVKDASLRAAREQRELLLARLRGQQPGQVIPIHPRAA